MKCDIFFKLFTYIFISFIFICPVFAEITDANVLSKLMIEQSDNNTYKINLIFDKKFTGNAFIQKGEDGTYFIYIPETVVKSNKIKIAYKDKKDRKNIKINIEEKPFIKENVQSNYVRVSVNLNKDYSISLMAQTIEHDKKALPLLSFNFTSLLFLIMFVLSLYLTFSMMKMTKSTIKNSYTSFPSSYLSNKEDYKNSSEIIMPEKQTILPKLNIKKTLRNTDSNSFSCFDIPLVDDNRQSQEEFKSTLKQTSSILKEKAAKSKHTNPISRNNVEDSLELDLPVVEDIKKTKDETEIKEQAPELLSELHITPTKGFYLTTMDDAFALFGYVGDKVFLLKKFNDLTQINLQARFYDRNANSDLYIVRLDSYKAMVEISDKGMKELAVL